MPDGTSQSVSARLEGNEVMAPVPANSRFNQVAMVAAFALVTSVFVIAQGRPGSDRGIPPGEWRYIGGDAAHTRYLPADQITASNFEKLEIASRIRNREFMATFTYTLTGLPAGEYVIETTLRDVITGKSGILALPIVIR